MTLTRDSKPDAPARSIRFEKKREEILSAAGALFNRHGLRDATLTVIASEIGLNLKSLRYYFERREDLVSAAFLRAIERFGAIVDRARTAGGVEARVRAVVHGYFEQQARIRRGEEAEVVHFGDLRALAGEHLEVVGAAYVDLFRAIRRLVADKRDTGPAERRNANAHYLMSQLLWSVVWVGNHAVADYARAAERFADILCQGIAADASRRLPVVPAMVAPFEESDRLSRASFLRAATTLVNDLGYRGASVDRISALLNVTKGAFYHHNDNRDDLIVACFQRTFDIVREAQDLALAEEADGLSHVALATVALVARQTRAEGVLLRTSALTAIGPELRVAMERRLSRSTWRFGDMLNDGLADGSVRICDIRIAGEVVTATINSAQELSRWAPKATADDAALLYVRPLIHGLVRSASE